MIKLVRLDERLIHGQVAFSWSTAYDIDTICVIDDVAAADMLQKTLLSMAVPPGKKFLISSVADAKKTIDDNSKSKIFIVIKNVDTILELIEEGVGLEKINVGGIYHTPDRKQITKTVYLTDLEIEKFKKVISNNIICETRTSPSDKEISLGELI